MEEKKQSRKWLGVEWRLGIALCLCILTVLGKIAAPNFANRVSRYVVGDGSERVQQAFFRMEEHLCQGDGLGEAVTAFCQELGDESA